MLRWNSHKIWSRGNILLYKLLHAVNFIYRSFISWKYWKAFAIWNTEEKNCSGVKVSESHTEKQLAEKLEKNLLHANMLLHLSLRGSFIHEKLTSVFLKRYNFSYTNFSFPFKHVLTIKRHKSCVGFSMETNWLTEKHAFVQLEIFPALPLVLILSDSGTHVLSKDQVLTLLCSHILAQHLPSPDTNLRLPWLYRTASRKGKYCQGRQSKLLVLPQQWHANQTLHWTWEFFIDFLHSICLSSIWALYTCPPLEMWSWGTRRTRWEIDTNFPCLVWVAWVFKVLTIVQKNLSIKHTTH